MQASPHHGGDHSGTRLSRPGGLFLWYAASLALVLLAQTRLRDHAAPEWVIPVAALVGAVLAIAPLLLPPRLLLLGSFGLIAGSGVILLRDARAVPPSHGSASIVTELYQLKVTHHSGVIPAPHSRGGGILRLNAGFLLVTGDGDLFQLSWSVDRKALAANRLTSAVPLGAREFAADSLSTRGANWIRVTGLVLDTVAVPARVLVAHQHWNTDQHCYTLRVSAAPLMQLLSSQAALWNTVYETHPCLVPTASYDPYESGGRLTLLGKEQFLLTVGDHGFDGLAGNALSQDTTGDYGKVLLLSRAGTREIFSLGHRNPQGVLVDDGGRIWETEHGPQGGDEVNILVRGNNYGWPEVTYGTQYGLDHWPLAAGRRDHAGYAEPIHVFVPSPAVTGIIQVGDGEFANWRGDFLVASLEGERLFRLRTVGTSVKYAEAIDVKVRIRDLVQDQDGTLLLWSDSGELLVLRVERQATGEQLFQARCSGCHGQDLKGTALGPSLRGVVFRRAASLPGFTYSDALRRKGGMWGLERLQVFLKDPEKFAPGTSMKMQGISSEPERGAIAEYLRTFRE